MPANSASISQRRHFSASQCAMAHAVLFPDAEKGGRGKKTLNPVKGFAKNAAVERVMLSQARLVIAWAPELVNQGARRRRAAVRAAQRGGSAGLHSVG